MVIEINGEPYLSTADAAKYVGVSAATFLKFQKEYKLPSMSRVGMGQRKFFKKKDLEPLLQFRPTGSRTRPS